MKQNLTKIIRSVLKQFWPGFKLSCCLIAFGLLSVSVSAQTDVKEITVKGKVTSAQGEPLNAVSIRVKNTTLATTTDVNGSFTLTVPSNAVLQISYVGFNSQDFPVAGKTQIDITLTPGAGNMSEVVVVGYSTQKKHRSVAR